MATTLQGSHKSKVFDGLEFVKQRAVHFTEFLPDRLYFATLARKDHINQATGKYSWEPKTKVRIQYFDQILQYLPFNKDFGPLNLGLLFIYCQKIHDSLLKGEKVVHITGVDKKTRANQAFLIGAYSIIYHGETPKSLEDRWNDSRPDRAASAKTFEHFEPFVHAGFGVCRYQLQLNDCLHGIFRALQHKFLDFNTFNLKEYRKHERVENGDFNWIVPQQFVAFCDPETYSENLGVPVSFFVKYFKKNNIRLVVRLNLSTYDATQFTDANIEHHDLIYPDGSIPSENIVKHFLSLCEATIPRSAVAVHCKAGLGRTGTLIACYMMKHYRFTAEEAIAWLRICRPGSVIGYQQKWLEKKQAWLWALGDEFYGRSPMSATNASTPTRSAISRASNNRFGLELLSASDDNEEDVFQDPIDEDLDSLMEDINNLGARLDKTASLLASGASGRGSDCSDELHGDGDDQRDNFTQGDYLNEIKLNRKKHPQQSQTVQHTPQDTHTTSTMPTCLPTTTASPTTTATTTTASLKPKRATKENSGISIVRRIPVLRARTTKITPDINNNQSAVEGNIVAGVDNSLRLYGKKMTKHSLPNRVLPH